MLIPIYSKERKFCKEPIFDVDMLKAHIGEHDDSFNTEFLTFLSAAWSKRQSEGLLSV